MKRRAAEIWDDARNDLIRLYDRIAEAANPATTQSYVEWIESYVRGFDIASERGVLRDNIRPGLRVVGYKHCASIGGSSRWFR